MKQKLYQYSQQFIAQVVDENLRLYHSFITYRTTILIMALINRGVLLNIILIKATDLKTLCNKLAQQNNIFIFNKLLH